MGIQLDQGKFHGEKTFILDPEEWVRFPLANMTEGEEKHSRWRRESTAAESEE